MPLYSLIIVILHLDPIQINDYRLEMRHEMSEQTPCKRLNKMTKNNPMRQGRQNQLNAPKQPYVHRYSRFLPSIDSQALSFRNHTLTTKSCHFIDSTALNFDDVFGQVADIGYTPHKDRPRILDGRPCELKRKNQAMLNRPNLKCDTARSG